MSSIRLGVISDVHLVFEGTDKTHSHVPEPEEWDFRGSRERLQRAVDRLERAHVDEIVLLGDLAHHGDDATLDRALADLAKLERPVWAAPGNHDVGISADAVARALRRAGHDGRSALASGQRVAVLGIESVDWIMRCRARSPLEIESWGNDLGLVASHYPLLARGEEPIPLEHLANGAVVVESLLSRSAPTIVLCGHLHTRHARASGLVLQLIFPSVMEQPARCSALELAQHEGRHRISRTVFGLNGGAEDAVDSWEFDGSRWVELTPTRAC